MKGVYEKGPSHYPGGRSNGISWTDEKEEIFYLFGGVGYGEDDLEGINIYNNLT